MKEGPTIFYHDGCMIQAPHGCFYYWTRGALSRGILNIPLHSRLNKNTLFSDCCCTIRWIATILSRINIKILLPLLLVPIMSVVPIMSLYFSLFQSCRAVHHITPFVASYSISSSTLYSCHTSNMIQDHNTITHYYATMILLLQDLRPHSPKAPKLLPPPPTQPTQQHRLAVQTVAGCGLIGHCDPLLPPVSRLDGRSSE